MNNEIEPQLTGTTDTEPVVVMADAPVSHPQSRSMFANFDKTKLILPGAILIAGLMVSGSILFARLSAGQALIAGQGQQPVVAGQKVEVKTDGSPVLGDAKAPVTVVEFGDFQCPFCRQYFENNQPSLVSNYVNTGKIKFVWEDYTFLGQESFWAAEAARCANDQGKFWDYHNYLYSHQGAENSGTFTKPKLEGFAAALGLDTASFNNCLNSDKYLSAVQQQTQYGGSVGVQGTPATFVNGVLVSGAVPYSQLKSAIDAALQAK